MERDLTRTERRRQATHERLLEATQEVLLERGARELSARLIAKRADHAVGTFYNHFADADAAVEEALLPVLSWAEAWASRLVDVDDEALALCELIASYLDVVEGRDGTTWAIVVEMSAPASEVRALSELAGRIDECRAAGLDEQGAGSDVSGPSGLFVVGAMANCGAVHGGRALDAGTRRRIARCLHAALWPHPDEVATRTGISLEMVAETRATDTEMVGT